MAVLQIKRSMATKTTLSVATTATIVATITILLLTVGSLAAKVPRHMRRQINGVEEDTLAIYSGLHRAIAVEVGLQRKARNKALPHISEHPRQLEAYLPRLMRMTILSDHQRKISKLRIRRQNLSRSRNLPRPLDSHQVVPMKAPNSVLPSKPRLPPRL